MWTCLHRATSRGCCRWTPLLCNIAAMASIVVCLGLAVGDYGPTPSWPVDPPISGLAETAGGFAWFAAGFTLLSTFLAAALLCRGAHIGVAIAAGPCAHRCLNITWVVLAALALPGILLMAFNADNGPNGTLHFIGAGVGMGLICVSGAVHLCLCLCISCSGRELDVSLPRGARTAVYVVLLLALGTGGACFGVWFASDKSSALLEWVGFIVVMSTFASYCVFYAGRPPPRRAQDGEFLLPE